MGWASNYITKLQAGETVRFRPTGNSMTGKIANGQLCTVTPVTDHSKLRIGDVVLCRVRGAEYLHLIKAIQDTEERFQIGNNKGGVNGWTSARNIFGICVQVES